MRSFLREKEIVQLQGFNEYEARLLTTRRHLLYTLKYTLFEEQLAEENRVEKKKVKNQFLILYVSR